MRYFDRQLPPSELQFFIWIQIDRGNAFSHLEKQTVDFLISRFLSRTCSCTSLIIWCTDEELSLLLQEGRTSRYAVSGKFTFSYKPISQILFRKKPVCDITFCHKFTSIFGERKKNNFHFHRVHELHFKIDLSPKLITLSSFLQDKAARDE